ncbi:heme NO-binding domain-containing protein [Jannaschia pohangensis]|uniref:Haem-NO-binding n=1 Tax=Jannaschia pohangensis TaxID=390807 RepID=A0A1I3SHF6_9RHOB|nr:heme NO-binding domain-containing protein [Jannaschia pohangensis]SFJ57071.1 Haem-NO-binding [Jannaschia pohangensis]
MHGLICKSLESFIIDRHGPAVWSGIVRDAGLDFDRFEMLRTYDTRIIMALAAATAGAIKDDPFHILEDMGHWLCTEPQTEAFRRLLRFTGGTFIDLIYSLDEMHDRANMALPGIDLPDLIVSDDGSGVFSVQTTWTVPGGCSVLRGMLRAMADDYGTLVVIDETAHKRLENHWIETLTIHVYDQSHQSPREFTLTGQA